MAQGLAITTQSDQLKLESLSVYQTDSTMRENTYGLVLNEALKQSSETLYALRSGSIVLALSWWQLLKEKRVLHGPEHEAQEKSLKHYCRRLEVGLFSGPELSGVHLSADCDVVKACKVSESAVVWQL